MTRPLLEDVRGMKLFSTLAALLAKAQIPNVATQTIRVGRLTLSKVAGDVMRRLVARTMAQQLQQAVEVATTPFQHALSMCGSAFALISLESMLTGLTRVEGSQAALPFVHDAGTVHRIPQGEGASRGMLCCPSFSVWSNTEHSKQRNVCCVTESVSWLFLGDIHFSSPSWSCMHSRAGRVVDPRRHPCSHRFRPWCGTRSASDQSCATFWRELLP